MEKTRRINPRFIMLVGMPGSGKSTLGRRMCWSGKADVIHSSDAIRHELLGDVAELTGSQQVLNLMLRRTVRDLKMGKWVIYDAANCDGEQRRTVLRKVQTAVPSAMCDCIFVAPPFRRCLERNRTRIPHVAPAYMLNMYFSLDLPIYQEGWDRIRIRTSGDGESLVLASDARDRSMEAAVALRNLGREEAQDAMEAAGVQEKSVDELPWEHAGSYRSLSLTAGVLDPDEMMETAFLLRFQRSPEDGETDQHLRTVLGDASVDRIRVFQQRLQELPQEA